MVYYWRYGVYAINIVLCYIYMCIAEQNKAKITLCSGLQTDNTYNEHIDNNKQQRQTGRNKQIIYSQL